MNKEIEKFESDTHSLKIYNDETPTNPREWDNLGIMECSHNKYQLGDEQINSDNFNSWEEIKDYLIKEKKAEIIYPLYLYDHSGITMSITPFHCRWDSGQVGFIYTTKEKIRKYFNIKNVTKKHLEQAEMILKDEVDTYDKFLTGDVYGYVVTEKTPVKKLIMTREEKIANRKVLEEEDIIMEKEVDSCWGFYGDDIKNEIIEIKKRFNMEV